MCLSLIRCATPIFQHKRNLKAALYQPLAHAIWMAIYHLNERCFMKLSYFEKLFSAITDQSFSVRFWNGETIRYGSGEPEFFLHIVHEPSWSELVKPLSLLFGEAYMHGNLVLEGDRSAVAQALEKAYAAFGGHKAVSLLTQYVMPQLLSLRQNEERTEQNNIARHYDLGNDFFKLWLDKTTRSYSCAYFKQPSDTLDTAQENKIELVLKKLHLKPGMRLLDIGCGWGGLIQKAIEDYDVQAIGITLSKEQFSFVENLLTRPAYEKRGEVRLCSYSDIFVDTVYANTFDRVVSIGMFEHVGEKHYREYFKGISQLLVPGGLSLLHTLTKKQQGKTDPWIEKYIFPGGHIPSLEEVLRPLLRQGFSLLHMESLRRHYVKTLHLWHGNFSHPQVLQTIREKYGEEFIRMWDLYLTMAAAYLDIGGLGVDQFIFSKGVANDLPMTMAKVYD